MKKLTGVTSLFLGVVLFIGCSVPEGQQGHKKTTVEPADVVKRSGTVRNPVVVIEEDRIVGPNWKERPVLSKRQRFSGALDAHNQVRTKHNLPPLRWSEKLAKYSQQWANNLGRGSACKMYHRSGTPEYGENLFRSSAIIWSDGKREVSPVTIKTVVKSWADEEKWYNYQQNRCRSDRQCGHYTQVVWRNTKEVGCALQVCPDKSQTWVCSYHPAGNYTGVKPY